MQLPFAPGVDFRDDWAEFLGNEIQHNHWSAWLRVMSTPADYWMESRKLDNTYENFGVRFISAAATRSLPHALFPEFSGERVRRLSTRSFSQLFGRAIRHERGMCAGREA